MERSTTTMEFCLSLLVRSNQTIQIRLKFLGFCLSWHHRMLCRSEITSCSACLSVAGTFRWVVHCHSLGFHGNSMNKTTGETGSNLSIDSSPRDPTSWEQRESQVSDCPFGSPISLMVILYYVERSLYSIYICILHDFT